jgi:ubiquinone/menaquinone biosynthesis C-methylase UbiE
MISNPTCDDKPIWDLWMSVYHFPTLAVADELGLFNLLADKQLGADEIAAKLGLSKRSTEALLAVLAGLNLLRTHNGSFYLTDVSKNFLLPDSPYYWGHMIKLVRDLSYSCSKLMEALKKDKPIAYGGERNELWEVHEQDPKQAEAFTKAMHSHSFPAAMSAAMIGDFDGVTKVLDVAGGSGCFCIALAHRYPMIQFTLLELPAVCDVARSYVEKFGLKDRIKIVSGNMFKDSWPQGHDAIFFSNILHDWDLRSCEYLVKKSYDALPPEGKIYIHEMLLNDTKDGPLTAASFSMNMIYFTHGKQFTAKELTDLLTYCGFEEVTIAETSSLYSLVSGTKKNR